MAGLSSLLNTARDALSAQSYGLNVTGQNISNASTPLYVRREAILQNRTMGTQTTGSVVATGIRRAVDVYVDRQYFQASSMNSGASQYDKELAQIESAFNDLGGVGLGSDLDALFSSFQQLATSPTDTTARSQVLAQTEVFSTRVNEIADGLATQKSEMVERAKDIASEVTQRASELAKLNQQIAYTTQSGQDASDLIDQRNNKLLNLSEMVDTRIVDGEDGQISIQSAGVMLVEGGTAREFKIDLDEEGKILVLATRAGGKPPDMEVTGHLTGGSLAGVKQARDEDLFDVAGMFDNFVFDVAGAVNAQHASGVGLDGVSGRNIFDVGPVATGAARSITVSADVAGNPAALAAAGSVDELPGGSSNALLLGNLATTALPGATRTPAQSYGDLVGRVGLSRASATAEADLRQDIFAQAETSRESTSGVSLDEEMVSLQRYQRAYQAAASVITTVDGLLEELLAKVGR
jgi:flagellar hook-associated protein 1